MKIKLYLTYVVAVLLLSVSCKSEKKVSETSFNDKDVKNISDKPDKTDIQNKNKQKQNGKPVPVPIKNPVYFCENGKCKAIERTDAEKQKLSIIDLSNKFVPYVFSEQTTADSTKIINPYRKTYINLENDLTDEDGNKLKPGEHNYLEVYGIPPTLSVLKYRFLKDSEGCALKINTQIFKDFKSQLIWSPDRPKKYVQRLRRAERSLRKYLKRHHIKVSDLDSYVKNLKSRSGVVKRYLRAKKVYDTFVELQNRLKCEGLLKGKIKTGIFNKKVYKALRLFEKKHRIFGWGYVNKKTLKYLANDMLENDFKALRRVLYERVAHSLAIFEDGSIPKSMWQGKPEHRDLIGLYTGLLMKNAGIDTKEKALDFFKRHDSAFFDNLFIALKLPPLPEYYSSNMNFYVKITIGDVWYDVPYTADGKRKPQPLNVLPRLYFYVVYKGRKIPLTRLGTTAGGWQKEYFKKSVFLKYKSSDLGPREWKFLVGGPVWFPPATTPPRELITHVRKKGRLRAVPKYKVFGPSYASAYGLAMALHTTPRHKRNGTVEDLDRGIRSHGSVNYMSIRAGHSHGCHRLRNHLAVRLFSSILKRHKFKRLGPVKTNWSHFIPYGGKVFKVTLKSKGYYYELTPPIQIRVTRNNIMGNVKSPIKDLVRIPGVKYPPDLNVGLEVQPDGSLQPVESQDASETLPPGSDMVPSAVPDASSIGHTTSGGNTVTGTDIKNPAPDSAKQPAKTTKPASPKTSSIKNSRKQPAKNLKATAVKTPQKPSKSSKSSKP